MRRLIIFTMLFLYFSSGSYCQNQSKALKIIGLGSGVYNYASINEISDPFIYSGHNIDYLLFFRSVSEKNRFDLSCNYAGISRKPLNVTFPDTYSVVSRDDGHIYTIYSYPGPRKTKILNLTFEYYRFIRSIIVEGDMLGIGATEKSHAVITNGIENPEIVSTAINPGFVYSALLGKNITVQLKSNISVLSLYFRRPYSLVDPVLSTEIETDWDFIKNYYHLSTLNKFLDVHSEIELSRNITRHFGVMLNYTFEYLKVTNSRKLTSASNIVNIGATYNF